MILSWMLKFFNTKKAISSDTTRMKFLFIDDKHSFKKQAELEEIDEEFGYHVPFNLYYYNSSWSYQDYAYCKLTPLEIWQPLIYQKYASNFACPKAILEQSEQWYKNNDFCL